MTKEKMNNLYNISKKIVYMMIELGITNYNGYSLKLTTQENFLILRDTFISPTLKNVYSSEDLNNFIPATSNEIMKQFNSDLSHDFFKALENLYIDYIK